MGGNPEELAVYAASLGLDKLGEFGPDTVNEGGFIKAAAQADGAKDYGCLNDCNIEIHWLVIHYRLIIKYLNFRDIRMSRELGETATRLTEALRHSSAQALMVSHAVAARVGLNMTDLECLDIIQMSGGVTAGELARRTGLTTGAITTLIDRLVHSGYAERQDDPSDRRRVLVVPRADRMQALWQLYGPLQSAMEQLYEEYSEEELRTMAAFMERAVTISAKFVSSLQKK